MMLVNVVSAFTRNNIGGNLAGVVLLENSISEDLMQKVAKKLNYSETVFVERLDHNLFKTRFFTPVCEVDLCGHASIAAFHTLKEKNLIADGNVIQQTLNDTLNVSISDIILMEMSKYEILDNVSKEDCASLLNINVDDIVNVPKIIKVGLADVMVIVKDIDILNKIEINKQAMIDYSNKINVTGFHVASIKDNQYYVRNFAPACGIDEESATGTSNASMYIYLMNKGYIQGNETISFYQGDTMNNPSLIMVTLKDDTLLVGGSAYITKEIDIEL